MTDVDRALDALMTLASHAATGGLAEEELIRATLHGLRARVAELEARLAQAPGLRERIAAEVEALMKHLGATYRKQVVAAIRGERCCAHGKPLPAFSSGWCDCPATRPTNTNGGTDVP